MQSLISKIPEKETPPVELDLLSVAAEQFDQWTNHLCARVDALLEKCEITSAVQKDQRAA